MVGRHRFERWNVEAGQHVAQPLDRRRAGEGRERGGAFELVAGVEEHRTALAHVGVDAGHGGGGGRRGVGRDRPVDQREERQFVPLGVDADRLARLQRRALGKNVREARQARPAGGVDLAVAGDDVGQMGLADGLHGELVAGVIGVGVAGGQQRRGGDQRQGCGGRGRAAAEIERPIQPEHGQRVESEEQDGQCQQPRREIGGSGGRVGTHAGAGHAGEVERRQFGLVVEKVEGAEAFLAAVETWRVLGAGCHRGEVAGERLRLGGRRGEVAVAVEQAIGRNQLRGGIGTLAAAGGGREGDDSPQHVDEGARKRQVRPARVGGDVEEDQPALAGLGGGDQRRAVGERRPGAVGECPVGFGKNLARDGDVVGHGEACERALVGKARQRLRCLPGQAAAERAVAAAQGDRDQRVGGGGQPGSGEAHEDAAVAHPFGHRVLDIGGQVADVGHGDHRDVAVDQRRHGHGGVGLVRVAHVGEGLDGARDVVERRKQRLGAFHRCAGEEADAPTAEAVVEQLHGAGRLRMGDLEPGDLVADLDGQRHLRLCRRLAVAEGEGRVADHPSLDVARRHHAAGCGPCLTPDNGHGQRVGAAGRRLQRHQVGAGVGVDDHRLLAVVAEEAGKSLDVRPADAVGKPGDAAERRTDGLRQGGDERGALRAPGARHHRVEALEDFRRVGRGQRLVDGLGRRQERDRPSGVLGKAHDAVGRVHHCGPVRCRRPAVVDDEEQGPFARRHLAGRLEHRAGEGDDDQRRQQEAKRGQPPRAARRLFLLAGDLEQQPRRWKALQPRLRRHQAQEVPDHRQHGERRQHADIGEGQRAHAARPASSPLRLWRSARRACRASSGSVAGRSVRWTMNVQSSRRHSVFSRSRRAARRA